MQRYGFRVIRFVYFAQFYHIFMGWTIVSTKRLQKIIYIYKYSLSELPCGKQCSVFWRSYTSLTEGREVGEWELVNKKY